MINLNNINNLIELFINQYENQTNKNTILLSSLTQPVQNYSWQKTIESIYKLSDDLKKHVSIRDRCLLISENRPEWFITDMSIMLTGSITVPAYTTYSEKDYEHIIEDCKPSVIFVAISLTFSAILSEFDPQLLLEPLSSSPSSPSLSMLVNPSTSFF